MRFRIYHIFIETKRAALLEQPARDRQPLIKEYSTMSDTMPNDAWMQWLDDASLTPSAQWLLDQTDVLEAIHAERMAEQQTDADHQREEEERAAAATPVEKRWLPSFDHSTPEGRAAAEAYLEAACPMLSNRAHRERVAQCVAEHRAWAATIVYPKGRWNS